MRAASSAKRRSWNSCSSVFVWACSLLRLNRLPSSQWWMYTAPSSSRSSVTWLSIMLKKMLNIVGVRTQPCFMPLMMRKDPERSLFNLTWLCWSLWSWITMLRNFGGGSQGAPQSLSAHCVKRFGQVHKCYMQSFRFAPCISLGAVRGWTPYQWWL